MMMIALQHDNHYILAFGQREVFHEVLDLPTEAMHENLPVFITENAPLTWCAGLGMMRELDLFRYRPLVQGTLDTATLIKDIVPIMTASIKEIGLIDKDNEYRGQFLFAQGKQAWLVRHTKEVRVIQGFYATMNYDMAKSYQDLFEHVPPFLRVQKIMQAVNRHYGYLTYPMVMVSTQEASIRILRKEESL